MKQLLLTYEGFSHTNIGDYIQSLAAKQFMNCDEIVEWPRDNMSAYEGEEAKVIMNGWFTHKPNNWPPSFLIHPLFVSFHLNASIESQLLTKQGVSYLKKFEPIGCRDENTVEMLKAKGIKAYFSSCLTTTLGYKYRKIGERKTIYIVDPVHYVPESSRRLQKFKFLVYFTTNFIGVCRYISNIKSNNPYSLPFNYEGLNRLACLTRSYIVMRRLLTKEDLKGAVILTQYHFASEIPTNSERFERAEELLKMYASAKLVVTSRIHCALPCLGLGTPVIFLQNDDDSNESVCRFKGLIDYLNVIHFKKNRIKNSPYSLPLKITTIHNKELFKEKVDSLIKLCSEFL